MEVKNIHYWEELPEWLLEQRAVARTDQEFLGAALMLQDDQIERRYNGDVQWILQDSEVVFVGSSNIAKFMSDLVWTYRNIKDSIIDATKEEELNKWQYAVRHREVKEDDVPFWLEKFYISNYIFFDMYVDEHGTCFLPSSKDEENTHEFYPLKTFVVYLENK